MENVYNFKYIPKYLKDDFLFTKTYFKTDRKFILDLPKNSNLHFLLVNYLIKKVIKNWF